MTEQVRALLLRLDEQDHDDFSSEDEDFLKPDLIDVDIVGASSHVTLSPNNEDVP